MASRHSGSATPQKRSNLGESIYAKLRESRRKLDHAAANLSEKLLKEELERTTAAKHRAALSMNSSPVKIAAEHARVLDYLAGSNRSRSRSPAGQLDVGNEVVKSELEREIRCERLGLISDISPFRTESHLAEDAARRLRDEQ